MKRIVGLIASLLGCVTAAVALYFTSQQNYHASSVLWNVAFIAAVVSGLMKRQP